MNTFQVEMRRDHSTLETNQLFGVDPQTTVAIREHFA
jgi:hypothetical protein